jgi:hypothetical protein
MAWVLSGAGMCACLVTLPLMAVKEDGGPRQDKAKPALRASAC